GVATGDYDNDGWMDLYVTNFGPNQLWRNNGPGAGGTVTFSDVTREAGVGEVRWSIPAIFVDYDRDGWLDLFVGNYVEFTIESHRPCFTMAGAPDYCGPHAYKPESDRLLRNVGRGASGKVTFEDVTSRSGILGDYGSALGVTAADFDGNGWPDLYVGNDGMPNQMWVNLGGGRFRNDALLAGTGVNHMGRAEASMGVTVADFDADGDEDIFVTHLIRETNTLYLNDGSGLFEDWGNDVGLGAPSWPYTGFGTVWFDYDNDGWLDLLIANGEVKVIPELEARGDAHPLHQPNQLFKNLGAGKDGGVRFAEVTADAGPALALSEVSRGVAVGDVDNDGDVDVLLVNNNGPARLLINHVGQNSHWVGLRLAGGDATPRDMLGARAGVFRAGCPTLWRRVSTGGSFLSASDPRLLIGLGDAPAIERVVVEWPDGTSEQWQVEADRYTVLRRGSGSPLK
ncbi:MAG: CRTAC1 family protein, partial [Thermoanaerobaculia bacterium]